MILIVVAAIGGGLTTGIVLLPVSALAALMIAPLGASACGILACFAIAWRSTGGRPALPSFDPQTDNMVTALRGVADNAVERPADLIAPRHAKAA